MKEAAGENPDVKTLDELRKKIRENLEASKEHQQRTQAQDRILEQLVKSHDFPVPEALVEGQMDTRLERMIRTLAAQGVDPRGMNVDWAGLRGQQRDRAVTDVKAELILDRIATRGKDRCHRRRTRKRDRAHGRTQWRVGNGAARSLDKARHARYDEIEVTKQQND